MNHQPFKEWLLSEETLSAEQEQSLQEHLSSCDSCNQIQSSWRELEYVIKDAPEIEPASGFSTRFLSRLAEYQSRQRTKRSWILIGMTAMVASLLVFMLIFELWQLIQDPEPIILLWLDRIISIFANYYILQSLFRTTTWLNPETIFVGLVFLVGMISFMSVLWLSTYKKLSLAWRAE
jgi:hypothetical protein